MTWNISLLLLQHAIPGDRSKPVKCRLPQGFVSNLCTGECPYRVEHVFQLFLYILNPSTWLQVEKKEALINYWEENYFIVQKTDKLEPKQTQSMLPAEV